MKNRLKTRLVLAAAAALLVCARVIDGKSAGASATQIIEGPPVAFTPISVGLNGEPANGNSEYVSISANGRFVAYSSAATNLVAGDTNGKPDVFVYDRFTGVTTRESVSSTGEQADGYSYDPWVSDDGRYTAFRSGATNLSAGAAVSHIYLRDRVLGTTTLVDRTFTGSPDNGSYPFYFSMSDDGHYLAFGSSSDRIVPGDTNRTADVFVRDVFAGVTELVSGEVTLDPFLSPRPSISGEGRYVAFIGQVRGSSPAHPNVGIFVRDRLARLTTHESNESDASSDWSTSPSISGDGRFLTWYRGANGMYVRDRANGVTIGPIVALPPETWVSAHAGRTQSYVSSISSSGPIPTRAPEAYLFEPTSQTLIRVSPGSTIDEVSAVAGDAFALASRYALQPTPTNYTSDIYVVTIPAGIPGPPRNLAWSISGTTVTLTWAPPATGAAPVEYVIAAGSEPGRTDDAILATGSTSTTFSAAVPANGTFYVRVHARTAAGTGGPSAEIRVTVGSGRRLSSDLATFIARP